MLRRILFFLSFVTISFANFAQIFTVSTEQSLNSSKDSLYVSIFVSSAAPQILGTSNLVIKLDTANLDLVNAEIDSSGGTYTNSTFYDPLTLGKVYAFRYFSLNVNKKFVGPPANNVGFTPTFVGRVKIPIREKCATSGLTWSASAPSVTITDWAGTPDPLAVKVPPINYPLRDSIGGTLKLTEFSDTICQGGNAEIAFLLNGEGDFIVDFNIGAQSFTNVAINAATDTSSFAVNPAFFGPQNLAIIRIEDVNGCVETNGLNFTDTVLFIDQTPDAPTAGPNTTICDDSIILAANNPVVGNGTWTNPVGPGIATFTLPTDFDALAVAPLAGAYTFRWTIRSDIDGKVGACPSAFSDVIITFEDSASMANAGLNDSFCVASFPYGDNLAATAPAVGTGAWSVLSGPASITPPLNNINAPISFTAKGIYQIVWTVSNGTTCPDELDTVSFLLDPLQSTPSITTLPSSLCAADTQLVGNAIGPVGAGGFWFSASSAIIATPSNPTTNVSNLPPDSTSRFFWNAVSEFGFCPDLQDQVDITRFAQPDVSNDITVIPPGPNCNDVNIIYGLGSTAAGSSYNWTFPSGFTINSGQGTGSVDVSLADPSFQGDIIVVETTSDGCSGGIDTLNVIPQACTFTASFDILPNDTVCEGQLVTFISTSEGTIPATTTYRWDTTGFGGPVTEVFPSLTPADNFQVTFDAAGTKIVDLYIDDPSIPANDNISRNVVVLAPPSATFNEIVGGPICEEQMVTYSVTISGGAPPYTVDIDTGLGIITIPNYTSGDLIDVTLFNTTTFTLQSVSDNFSCAGGSVSGGPFTVNVNPLPKLSIISPNPADVCLGLDVSVDFTATGSLPFSSVYINLNGIRSDTITITTDPETILLTPTTANNNQFYSIDSVIDVNGCISSGSPNIGVATANFDVFPRIDSAKFTGANPICIGDNIVLTLEAFGGTGPFDYDLENTPNQLGQPSPHTINVSPPATITYTLDSIIDSNGCILDTNIDQTVIVNPLPTATLIRTAPTGNLCLGQSANFDLNFPVGTFPITVDLDSNGTSLVFTVLGDTTLSFTQTSAATLNFNINSITDVNGCTQTVFGAPINIVVNDAPVFASLEEGDTICDGDTDNLTALITGGTQPYSLTITGIGTFGSYNIGDSIPVTPPLGVNVFTLTNVTDANSCSLTLSDDDTTVVLPIPTGTITGNSTICAGDSTQITFNIPTGVGPFNVIYNDGTSSFSLLAIANGDFIWVQPSVPTTYTLDSVYDVGIGCGDSVAPSSVTFTVNSPYSGTISAATTALCATDPPTTISATITAGYTLQWLYGGNPISGETSATISVDYSGSFSLEASNGSCIDTVGPVNIQVAPPIDVTVTVIGDLDICEGDTTILSVPLYGGNNLRGSAKNDDIRNIGTSTDFNFIHQTGQFTLQYWQKLNNPNTNKINIAVGNSYDGTEPGFFAGVERGGTLSLNREVKLHIDGDGANPFVFHTTSGPFNNTDWHQVTISVDSAVVSIYFDGVKLPSILSTHPSVGPVNYQATSAVRGLSIGNAAQNPAVLFPGITNDGGVDEVRIWNFPLDSATIVNNWNRPLNGNEPGLVALFDLDEDTTSTSVQDKNATFTGTINGGAQLRSRSNAMPAGLNYQWFNGAIPIAGANQNTFAATGSGVYTVEVTNANNPACMATSAPITITKFDVEAQVNILNNDTACFGSDVQLQGINSLGAVDSVKWYLGSELVSINANFTTTLNGNYRLEVFNGPCSDDTTQGAVILSELNTTGILYRDTVLCEGESVQLVVSEYGGGSFKKVSANDNIQNVGTVNDFRFINETGTATFEFWAKIDWSAITIGTYKTIISNSTGNPNRGFNLSLFASTVDASLSLRYFNGAAPAVLEYRSIPLIAGGDTAWHHYALVSDSGRVSYFFDGVLLDSDPVSANLNLANTSIPQRAVIGGVGPNFTFIGKMDELRIWKTALDEQSIANNYQRPINDVDPLLATIFNFDEDTTLRAGAIISNVEGTQIGILNGATSRIDADNPFRTFGDWDYQWYRDGISLGVTATTNTLTVDSSLVIGPGDSSVFFVEIGNSFPACSPEASSPITIKINEIVDTLSYDNNDYCFGTDVTRIWVDWGRYSKAEIYNANDNSLIRTLLPSDSMIVDNDTSIYGIVFRTIDGKECFSLTDTLNINVFENPEVRFADNDTIICFDSLFVMFDSLRGDLIIPGEGIINMYSWNPTTDLSNATIFNPTYSALSASDINFELTATDDNGCFGLDSIRVEVNPKIVVTLQNDTTLCYGLTLDLGFGITEVGGKAPQNFSYLWDNDSLFQNQANVIIKNPIIDGDSAGIFNYGLLITDNQTGCIGRDTLVVTVNDSIDFSFLNLVDTICFNTSSIVIGGMPTAQGGSGTISTYAWSPITNLTGPTLPNPTFNNPGAGTYTYNVTATDAVNCERTSNPVTVVVAPDLTVNAGVGDTVCYGDSSQALGPDVGPVAIGGFGRYSYEWSIVSPLGLNASDFLNNTTIDKPTISFPNASLFPGGTVVFRVDVTDSSTALPRTSCDYFATTTVIFNPEIMADAGSVDFVCFDDTVSLAGSATGGSNSGFTYVWGGQNQLLIEPTDNTTVFDGTASGLYNLTLFAFDATYPQCFDDSASFVFEVNDTLFANAGADTSICFGEQLKLGGFISGTDTTAGGGTAPFNYTWINKPGPVSALSNNTIQRPLFNTLGNTVGGIYTYEVTVTDSKFCVNKDSISIDINNEIFVTPISPLSVCLNDTLSIGPSVIGGDGTYSYLWTSNNGNNFADATQLNTTFLPNTVGPDNVNLTVTDSRLCSDSIEFVISVIDLPQITLTPSGRPEICLNDSIILSASANDANPGSLTFTWNDTITTSTIIVSPPDTSDYIMEVQNSTTGCRNYDTVTVVVNPLPDVVLTTSTSLVNVGLDSFALCVGGPNGVIQVIHANNSITGTLSTLWKSFPLIPIINTSGQFASFSSSDLDQVSGNIIRNVVTDVKGCRDSMQVHVSNNSLPNALFISDKDTICQGESITLTAVNGPIPFGLDTTYTFKRILPAPANNNISCCGDTSLTFIPGIDDANPDIIVNTATTFIYSVEISKGSCTSILTKEIRVNPLPDLVLVPAMDSVCFGDLLNLSVSNGNPNPVPLNNFVWGHTAINNDSVDVTILSDSIFTVVATDTNGCVSDPVNFDIKVKALPNVTLDVTGPIELCIGDDSLISVLAPLPSYTYIWKDSSQVSIPVVQTGGINYLAASSGNYFVEITTTGASALTQCKDTSVAIDVTVNPLPVIQLDTVPNTAEFCFGTTVDLIDTVTTNVAPVTYQWDETTFGVLPSSSNTLTIDTTGDYILIVLDGNGCIDTSLVQVFTQLPLSTDSIVGSDSVCAFTDSVFVSSSGVAGTWRVNNTIGNIIGGVNVGAFSVTPSLVSTITISWNGPATTDVYFTPDPNVTDCAIEDTLTVTILPLPTPIVTGPVAGCSEDTLTFNVQSPLAANTYTWSQVNGNIGSLLTPLNLDSVSLQLGTTFPVGLANITSDVQVIEVDKFGCRDTASIAVQNDRGVEPGYQNVGGGLDLGLCLGDSVGYTISQVTAGATYTYTLQAGAGLVNTITPIQSSVNWNGIGNWNLTVNAVNGTCSEDSTNTFTVVQSPTNSFTYRVNGLIVPSIPNNVCINNTDTFTYEVDGILVSPGQLITWVLPPFVNNITAAGDSLSRSFTVNSIGVGNVSYTQFDPNGCEIVLTDTFNVNDFPVVPLISYDSILCQTDSQQFISLPTFPSFYTINIQAGPDVNASIVSNNLVVNWGSGTPNPNKFLELIIGNGDCFDTVRFDVTLVPKPEAVITSARPNPVTFCESERVRLFANPSDTTFAYEWFLNGITINDSISDNILINLSGTYTVGIQTPVAGCSDTSVTGFVANVLEAPEATISGDASICAGETVTLTASTPGVTPTTFQWFRLPDTITVIGTNASIDVGSFGSYYAVLQNTSGNNCTDTSDIFDIDPLADAVSIFSFDSVDVFCNNSVIPLRGRSAGQELEFEWFTNGQGILQDPFTDTTIYIPSDLDSGLISFEFTVSNKCLTDVAADTARLLPSPDASYTPSSLVAELNEFVTFTPNNPNAILYEWVFQPGATATGPLGLHQYTQQGDYLSFLIATNEFNCTDSFAVPIHVTRNQLIYVPNVFSPNAQNQDNRVMRVYGTNIAGPNFEIVIFNRWGAEVFKSTDLTEMKLNGWNGTQNNDGPELPSGVYTYSIKGTFIDGKIFQQVGTVSLIK